MKFKMMDVIGITRNIMDSADEPVSAKMRMFSSLFAGHIKDAFVKGLMTGSRDTLKTILGGIKAGKRAELSAEKILEWIEETDPEEFLKYMLEDEYFDESVED